MLPEFSIHHFRVHLEPKAALHMPAYNKGNVIRGGFGSMFLRIVCHGNLQRRVRDRVRERVLEKISRRAKGTFLTSRNLVLIHAMHLFPGHQQKRRN
jgi:hypothetical protein